MAYKRPRRAHVITKTGAPIRSTDPVATYIKPKRPTQKKRSFAFKVFAALLIVFALYGIVLGAKAFATLNKISVKNESGLSPLSLPKLTTQKLAGASDGRVNLLLIGVGGAGHPGGTLADTIMVASINPKDHSLAFISIPRDLRVTYPKPYVGQGKINSVHSFGEDKSKKVTGGGPALLKKTVTEVIGQQIHYFVRIDFSGFKELVDTLGGVTVTVDKAINDPLYPAPNLIDYSPFKIAAGTQKLNGEVALKYVRSRETTSDFDRARRQQQVIEAMKEKALSVGVLTNPKKVLSIIDVIGQHLQTDLQPAEMEQLMSIFKDISHDKVTTKVIDNGPDGPLVSVNEGGYYLVPKSGNYKDIQKIVSNIFAGIDSLAISKASVTVLNGSSKAGTAATLADSLKEEGYVISKIDKAPETVAKTTIYNITGKKTTTLTSLEKELGVTSVTTIPTNLGKLVTGSEIVIVVGEDYRASKKTN